MSDEDWAVELATRQTVIDNYMKNDEWAVKIKKDVGVLLTSSCYSRPYMKSSIESHKKLGYWTTLVYDNFINPEWPNINYNEWFPPKDVMDMVDTFVLTHHQTWGGVSYPYMWSLKLASGFMQNFEYVLCDNGDCVIENPEGFPKMLEALGDGDILSSGPALEREIGTAGILMRSSAFFKIADHMIRHVVPFSEYEKSTQSFGNTEGRLAVAVRDLGLKQVIVEPPFNEQLHEPGHGFWWKTIGYRHIHGEMNYAYRYKKIPPPFKYLDERFLGDADRKYIKLYDETKDPEILKEWWCKD